MFITGLGLALPPRRFTQAECWEAFQAAPQFARLTARSRKLLQKVLLDDNGIATRHAALNSLSEAFELPPDILHARFGRHAPARRDPKRQQAQNPEYAPPTERGQHGLDG